MEEGAKLELRRQVFHIALGSAIMILVFHGLLNLKMLMIVFFVGLAIAMVSLRSRIPCICWFLDKFERQNVFPGKGALFFILGCIMVLVLFDTSIALASIAVLTFGDSLGPLIGLYHKRRGKRFNGRLVEGFIVAFVVSFLAAAFFVPMWVGVVGSFVALTFEFFEIKLKGRSVDDNLFVPLIAGSVMYFVMFVL